MIKNEQGHIVIDDIEIIANFEKWLIGKFDTKKLYGEPQLQWEIAQGLLGKCDIACDD